jgi:hypothetical protein
MEGMFRETYIFNQPIGNWDVSKVKKMCKMFHSSSFNQYIGDWDVSNVTNMEYMFYYAESFNQDLSSWQIKPHSKTVDIFNNCPIKEEYKPKGIK